MIPAFTPDVTMSHVVYGQPGELPWQFFLAFRSVEAQANCTVAGRTKFMERANASKGPGLVARSCTNTYIMYLRNTKFGPASAAVKQSCANIPGAPSSGTVQPSNDLH